MKTLQHVLGCGVACLDAVDLHVAATFYDSSRRHSDGARKSLGQLFFDAQFIALGSAVVGLVVGALGVALLHSLKRSALRDYSLAGLGLGATTGALFTAAMHHPGDPAIS